ncbi:DUF3707 domain-containing protein [Haematococcus lacustris]|uniref:DUF3707 domain-containing protein n=1 Tax=Haematococcus lacustris TaxID=44745 RepID=A0A699ZEK0_HAELA|nr:DUF3707 domain-containing protein [Haematococcus lacustris]
MYVSFELVLIAVVASWATACHAGDATGSGFPYFDNCRRSLSETRFDVRLTSEAVNPVNGSVFCWTVYVKPATACLSPQRRCCSTSFAKVKLYTSRSCCCGSNMHVGESSSIMAHNHAAALPSCRPALQQELQCDASDSATDKLQCDSICVASLAPFPSQGLMEPPCVCACGQPGKQITNPVLANRSLFELGIYDRKVDNYECCPTFAYNLGKHRAAAGAWS